MKRILSALMCISIIVSSMLACLTMSVSAESLYIRKIVSVVCDDSNSMDGDKWAYANYAMQAFCGMLNSEDQLFITYMAPVTQEDGYKPEQVDLTSSGIQASVDSIKNHTESWDTPYGAVEMAQEKLKSVNDSNPNTQYWLVVITDGSFNECAEMTDEEKKDFLNEHFGDCAEEKMPNGTKPQITFLGIGNVVAPDPDTDKGIYTYSASNASGIIGAMSEMADKISGRTRLQKSDLKKTGDNTVQISSSIPLLNIAVFTQGSNAAVTEAVFGKEIGIPVTRNVSLNYPNYPDLVGGAYLLGDSQNVIGAGTYDITFDKKVDPDDVIILFEPALETKMSITVNGNPVSDFDELDDTMEGDKVSVSYAIYEKGTDTKIDPSLLPPDTKFEITVLEDGKEVKKVSGKEMELSEYTLNHKATEITSSVTIEGFNPIKKTAKFVPSEYIPQVVYSIVPSLGGAKNVKLDQIGDNTDVTVCFTVEADGTEITDPEAVKALNPVISVSPQGNSGDVSYSNDGKIVFTPKAAGTVTSDSGSFDVEVKCTLDDGTTASEVYTVLVSAYQVIPVDTDKVIKKTELYDNKVSVSFYITKDGAKLDKAAVENGISVLLNEEYASLKTNVDISEDGTITVTPYSEEKHELTFWNWWINWLYYFGLESKDITVTLNHSFGSADSVIDVVRPDIKYLILDVYLPLVIDAFVVLFLLWWAYCIFAKPKFLPDAVLYIASLSHNDTKGKECHSIGRVTEINLEQYNALKHRWKPTLKSKVHFVGKDLYISAAQGGSIICHSQMWYKGSITPICESIDELNHPHNVYEYTKKNGDLEIEEISLYDTNTVHAVESIDNPSPRLYYIHTKLNRTVEKDGVRVINSGTIFAYACRPNH